MFHLKIQETFLAAAVRNNNVEIVQILLKNEDIDVDRISIYIN